MRVIIWEQANAWSVSFRWLLKPAKIRVDTVRSWRELCTQLESTPNAPVIVELHSEVILEFCERLQEFKSHFPKALVIIAAPPILEHLVWPVRELGVYYVVTSTRDLIPIRRVIQNHTMKYPQVDEFRSLIWKRMPWANCINTGS